MAMVEASHISISTIFVMVNIYGHTWVNYRYKMRKPRKPYQFQKYLDTIKIKDVLTRAHPVVSAEHQRPGGGGGWFPPPPLRSRKLRRLEKNGKRRLVDWEKHYKKHSDNFSLKSKLRSPEVIKGKIFPNFRITWHGFILCALSRSL